MSITLLTIVYLAHLIHGINLLPCTEQPTLADMQLADDIIQDAFPPGYSLVQVEPMVSTGRNPNRWIAFFTRNDNHSSCGCQYISHAKAEFKRLCPQGSDISFVHVNNNPNRQRVCRISSELFMSKCSATSAEEEFWTMQCFGLFY
ncbi:hypothetical protein HHI36_022528 [Cryptolaemus montrouzieri]|uniref:Uncharacterized protein n=1 Tax=Cryptolaemus montrouzieri TaxID=559131 RepID=A0ABD2N185_9CUCU